MNPIEIYLDCDGVLADFAGAACRLHGWGPEVMTKWAFYENKGMSAGDFWAPIAAEGARFASGLDKLPWAERLYGLCVREAPTTILTAPWHSALAWGGRVQWLEEFGVPIDRIVLAASHYKARLAVTPKGPNMLIDDNEDNVDNFCLAGGVGLLWPSPANKLRNSTPWLEDNLMSVMLDLQHAIRLARDYGLRADRLKWLVK